MIKRGELLMHPEVKSEVEQEVMYQQQILKLIAQGHNTRSAKRKIAKENK